MKFPRVRLRAVPRSNLQHVQRAPRARSSAMKDVNRAAHDRPPIPLCKGHCILPRHALGCPKKLLIFAIVAAHGIVVVHRIHLRPDLNAGPDIHVAGRTCGKKIERRASAWFSDSCTDRFLAEFDSGRRKSNRKTDRPKTPKRASEAMEDRPAIGGGTTYSFAEPFLYRVGERKSIEVRRHLIHCPKPNSTGFPP